MWSQRVGQDLATKQQQQGRIKWYKEEECFDIEKHVPRLIVAMTTIFLQPSKTGTSTACRGRKKKKAVQVLGPQFQAILVASSHTPYLSQTNGTVSVLLPSSQGNQTLTPLHHVIPVPHTNLWAGVTIVASLFVNSVSELEAP